MTDEEQEVHELAALALRNAFYHDFSALVNTYLAASEGLAVSEQHVMLGELTSLYGRDHEAKGDLLNIWTQHRNGTCGHQTMAEALAEKTATEIHLQGSKVLKRKDGEWCWVD